MTFAQKNDFEEFYMVEEESFETEKYEFHFYQDERFGRTNTVKANVVTVEGRDLTNDDLSELKLFFDDMGKWENLSITTKNLLEDLGIISKKGTEEPKKKFGSEKYNIEMQDKDDFVMITIRFTPEERRRRTREGRQSEELSLKEITEQVKNVPKWQMLKKTLSDLRKQV